MTEAKAEPERQAEARAGLEGEGPELRNLVDIPRLQAMQDLFAELTGTCVVVCDRAGEPITEVSGGNPASGVLLATEEARRRCLQESCCEPPAGGLSAVREYRFAGVVHLVVPIRVDGRHLGSVVVGHLGAEEEAPEEFAEAARRLGVSLEELRDRLQRVQPLGGPRLRWAVELLGLMANTLAELSVRGAEVRRTVRQLATVHEIGQLLSSARRLDEVLRLTAEALTKTLNLKACAIRLLDERTGELTVRASYNLSERYLKKGPVMAASSPLDQEAMKGKVVQVPDITADDRFLYKQAMLEEGIRSMFFVGLMSRGKPLGALRLYSSVPRRLDPSEERLFAAAASQVAAAIENARLYQETLEKERLEYELNLAASIQQQLLPRSQPQVLGYDIHGLGVPCELVGGDFYDFIPVRSGRLGLAIADGAGKGVPGALLMAIAHTALRVHSEHITAPKEILARTNRQLCRRTKPGQFVTLFYGLLNPLTATFTYANAGHNAPLLWRAGAWETLEADGIILGVEEGVNFEQREITLREDDVLVLYTDGVTEAMNEAEELFGEERLKEVIAEHAQASAQEIARQVVRATREFSHGQPQHDDITLIILKVSSE